MGSRREISWIGGGPGLGGMIEGFLGRFLVKDWDFIVFFIHRL